MKIGFDAKRLYNNFTGLGNHSRTTIDILTQYFPDNDYVLYTPKVSDDNVVKPYLSKDRCLTRQPEGFLRGSLWRTFGMAGSVEKDGVELFHGLSNELPIGLKVPSVVTIHDVAFRTFPEMYHWHDRHIYDMKWRYACRHADRIIAISECTKKDVIRFYGVDEKKIDVVYQPVNPIYYTDIPAEINDTPKEYMLYVGSINSRKNLLGIVKALNLLPDSLRIPLLVIGSGREYKHRVEKYVAEHNLGSYVRFCPPVNSQEELRKYYLNARLFIYPSFYEGFGLPVVEALLSECPVVTSNVSCLPEAGGPYSLKADPENPADIKNNIQRLLEDDALRNELAKKGRQWAMETFHPSVLSKRLMSVYEKIV